MKHVSPATGMNPDFFSTQVSQARRFYLNLNPPPQARLAVVCGGLENCTADYAISRRTFPFYSVEFVAAGKGRLKLNGQEHDLQPGSVFSYGPAIAHDIATDAKSTLVNISSIFPEPRQPSCSRPRG